MNSIILLSEQKKHKQLFYSLKTNILDYDWILIDNEKEFTINNLRTLKPFIILIPHWSYIIPKEIYNTYECIVFHMTDLPFGRGGTPLQNLIVRGFKKTKISAFKVAKGIDTGDIYLKKELDLDGTAEEIFERSSKIIEIMIKEIILKKILPLEQKGQVVVFKRRTPKMSNIEDVDTIEKIYDYIRMLDAEGYPNAFIENKHFIFTFTKANIIGENIIEANVRIIKK